MPFEATIARNRDAPILRCRGRLVLGDGAESLRRVACRELAQTRNVALDLASITQIDARGVGVLAELCAAARRQGRVLRLAAASDRVHRVLRLTRLDTLLQESSTARESTAPADVLTASIVA